MRVIFNILLLLGIWSLVLAEPARAHVGMQPFLLVNGKYADTYPVYSASIENFILPQDVAVENFLVGQNIEFTIDLKALPPIPEDLQGKIKFVWDFKDGTRGEGLKIQHKFNKIGPYIVDLQTDDGTGLQSMDLILVNILPDASYKLPQSIVKVEDQSPRDPVVDVLYLPYGKNLKFDGSASKSGSTPIKSYYWDLGDQTTSKNIKTTHAYKSDLGIMFPLLRVTDQNGFFSDNYAQVSNQDLQQSSVFSSSPTQMQKNGASITKSQLGITIPILFFYTALGFVFRSIFRKS
jgi:hypothetical protein